MGQFANQPDFGTFAASTTKSDTIGMSTNLKSSCLYIGTCLLYTSPSPRDRQKSRMPSSA